MNEPLELAVPARRISVQVTVGPPDDATTLEDLVARALVAGYRTVKEQSKLFSVPQRIVIEVISSLWAKGLLTVDFEDGSLDLSDTAREILAKRGRLVSADTKIESRRFIYEPITGLILPEEMSDVQPRDRSIELPLRTGVTETSLPEIELTRAVQAAIRTDRRRGYRSTVRGVNFGHPMLRPPSQLCWLHMTVTARRDARSDRVSLEVQDSRWGSEMSWQRLSEYVADLADSEPEHPAVVKLRGRAQPSVETTQRIDVLLGRMAEVVRDLGTAEPSQVEDRQRALKTFARRVQERLAVAARARAAVTVVRSQGHDWMLHDLIQNARTQLIIISPSLDYGRLAEVLPDLREALGRGVSLVVIWGRADADRLPDKVRGALDELELRYGSSRVLVGRRSARTEACVVLQDDQRALVGSHSPLGTDPLGPRECSLLVEPCAEGPHPAHAVVDLLIWARDVYPNHHDSRRIRLQPHQFGQDRSARADRATASGELTGPVVLDVPLPELDSEAADDAARKLWQSSWAEHHGALVRAYLNPGTSGVVVDVLRDGEHRAQLWQGVRSARRRLVISDDRAAANLAVGELVKSVRDRRTAVKLLAHPRLGSGDRGAGLEGIPERIEQQCGRVIVTDDEAVVGSFSPLGEQDTRSRRSARSQVGLRVYGELVADEVAVAVGASRPASTPDAGPEPVMPGERRVNLVALPLLIAARAAGRGATFGRQVVDRLRDVDEPWEALDWWHRTGVPATELRTAIAALLGAGIGAEAPDATRWSGWLVHEAWSRRCFVEGALAGRLLRGRPGPLDSAATLTAALEVGPLGLATIDATLVLADHDGPERTAGAAGALAEMLLWSSPEGEEAVRLLWDALPGAWHALAREAVAVKAAPPLAAVAAERDRVLDQIDMAERRRQLIEEIDKLQRLRGRFNFDTGTALHDALFAREGLLTKIRHAAEGDAAAQAAVRDLLPDDVRKHLNDLILRAGESEMQWYKQVRFLRTMEEIVRAARIMAGAPLLELSNAEETHGMRDFAELARGLARTWDTLFSEADEVKGGFGVPLLALLDRLGPLAWWGREHP